MFKLGTVPFIGDYIDIGAAPAFVPNGSGGWTYNTAPTTHAAGVPCGVDRQPRRQAALHEGLARLHAADLHGSASRFLAPTSSCA